MARGDVVSDVAATITGQNIAINLGTLDGVSGGAALTTPDRLVSVASGAAIKQSDIQDGVSGSTLTIGGTLTAPRTATFPDADVSIPGGGVIARTVDIVFTRPPRSSFSSFNSFPPSDAGIAASPLDPASVVARANLGA